MQVVEAHDFPGILENIDWMYWEWKNYPLDWKGVFAKRICKVPTLLFEAVASYDLWIQHDLFGCLGSLNYLNIIDRSLAFKSSMGVRL